MAPSKALTHVRHAMEQTQSSILRYGLPPTTVFYTDSPRIEEPSLKLICPEIGRRSAAPISTLQALSNTETTSTPPLTASNNEHSPESESPTTTAPQSFPFLNLPAAYKNNIKVLKTNQEIEDAANIVNDAIASLSGSGSHVVIGLDSEWTVTHRGQREKVAGKVAVIQWAYNNAIYIAQVPIFFFFFQNHFSSRLFDSK